jgi:hypothetical protein
MIMRIRFTRAGYAVAAGVAVTAMLGMSAASAAGASVAKLKPDATTACGASCTDYSFTVPGPSDILAAHSGLAIKNNIVRLVQGSNAASKEDFTPTNEAAVVPTYCTTGGQAQTGSVFTNNQCNLLVNDGLSAAKTFELAFNPDNSGPSDLCIGAWDNGAPANGWKVRLEYCGVASDTVIIETATLPAGSAPAGTDWFISGASDNFSRPLVLTNPGFAPSQVTWTTVNFNGGKAADEQEVVTTTGPF